MTRKSGELLNTTRLLCIGAHPDDCEFQASGLAALTARAGGTVRFLSVTDGSSGHHQCEPDDLIEIRRIEAIRGAAAVGADVVNLGFEDGWLFPDRRVREAIITQIRLFAPDVVICPRPSDYHPDHRATGTAVQDAGYLLMVPKIVPTVPVPPTRPVLLYMSDPFCLPTPFRPDLVFDIGPVVEDKLDAIMAHRSQVYEWLPRINGFADEIPIDEPERTVFLRDRERAKIVTEAITFGTELMARYGHEVRYCEAYQISEYGAPASPEEVYRLLGMTGG